MQKKSDNNVIGVFDSIVDSTDELVKLIRNTKSSNNQLLGVLERVIVFMGEIIRFFPDMISNNDEKTPLQRLNISYRVQKDAFKYYASNSALFYLQWYNFKLQWNNYMINYHITEINDRSFFISLN